MSYPDIARYLKTFGVDTSRETSGVNSKWVYTKELLADASNDTIVRISDELNIPHNYAVGPSREMIESDVWAPNHFRLFLSHISPFKKQTALLQNSLRHYGVSAFVAHVDIEPTKEWQDEIEAALYSMDALAAILMPGFNESKWTDQEVGVAIGRGTLVIPIMRGLTPYGLMGKFQGLNAGGKSVKEVAREVFDILASSQKTKNRALATLIETTLKAESEADGLEKLEIIAGLEGFQRIHFEKLRDSAVESRIFGDSEPLRRKLKELLTKKGLAETSRIVGESVGLIADEDIPF